MSLEKSLKRIREFVLERYKDNLAAILIFGSANTGHFKEGESDIDAIILLKRKNKLDFVREINFLVKKLKSEEFACQYLHTPSSIENYIKKRKSWSTYIVVVSKDGSKVLYSTPEFQRIKKELQKTPPTKKNAARHFVKRDKFDLEESFTKSNWSVIMKLMSHTRNKLQALNYFKTKKLVYDYKKCLKESGLPKQIKKDLEKLYDYYEKRKKISKKQAIYYYGLSKELTKILKQMG